MKLMTFQPNGDKDPIFRQLRIMSLRLRWGSMTNAMVILFGFLIIQLALLDMPWWHFSKQVGISSIWGLFVQPGRADVKFLRPKS